MDMRVFPSTVATKRRELTSLGASGRKLGASGGAPLRFFRVSARPLGAAWQARAPNL